MKENHYKGLQNAILRGSGLVILFVIMSVLITGCDDNNNNQNESLRAVLSVRESPNVPGRIELDPRGSKPGVGQKLESHTIEVVDLETGETAFGPVTESANSDSALKKMHFPRGDYLAILTVSATTIIPDGDTDVRGPEGQQTDREEKEFSVDAVIAFPEADSCQATCSKSFVPGTSVFPIAVCSLPTGCFTLDLVEDVLNQAQTIDPSFSTLINENTTMWIQAYGSSGGNGTSPDLGGDGGKSGAGGFAQTITTVAGYKSSFGATTIFYYLGEAGEHDDSGGTGGASTIVTSVIPQSEDPITLSDIVLIAGGGGGGGEGELTASGSKGGGGGFANSTSVGESDTDKGGDGGPDAGGNGGGGTSCSEGIACGANGTTDDNGGHQGFGGESGGSDSDDPGPRGWINQKPELEDDAGKGGEGTNADLCAGGGGGGGFGGGSGGFEGVNFACDGGGGGGSYAAASTTTDGSAPTTNPKHSGDGEVLIVFNTDPSM